MEDLSIEDRLRDIARKHGLTAEKAEEVVAVLARAAQLFNEPASEHETDVMLRMIAAKHRFTADQAEAHRAEVWARMHGKGPDRHSAVDEAWTILPGSYSYYDAASRMARVLA